MRPLCEIDLCLYNVYVTEKSRTLVDPSIYQREQYVLLYMPKFANICPIYIS